MASRTVNVKLDGDASPYIASVSVAERATEALREKVDRLDGRTIRMKIKLESEGDLSAIARINRLENKQYRIGLHVDRTGATNAELATLDSILRRIPRTTRSSVSVNTSGALSGVSTLGSAIAAVGPAGVTAGVVAAGGLGAMTTMLSATAIGAGTAMLAFSGFGEAVGAVREAQINPTAENLKKADEALRGFGESGRNLAREVASLGSEMDKLKRTAQDNMFPGLSAGLASARGALPAINGLVAKTGEALGELGRRGGEALNSPFWRDWFAYMEGVAGPILLNLGTTIGHLIKGWAGLSKAFGPLAKDMAAGLANMAKSFSDWASTLDQNQGFQRFIDYVRTNGPVLLDTLKEVGRLFLGIVQAAMPVGAVVLPILRDVASALADLMQSDAGPIIMSVVAAIGGLIIAQKMVTGIVGLGTSLLGLGSGATGAVGALAGVGPAIAGVAAVAAIAAVSYQAMKFSADDAATALQEGGTSAAEALPKLREHDAQVAAIRRNYGDGVADLSEWVRHMTGIGATTKQANVALGQQLATMNPLQQATALAAVEQSKYDDAVRRFGQGSQQAADAQNRLRQAHDNVALRQQLANKTGADYYATLGRIAQGSDGAAQAARDVAAGMKQSELDAMGASVKINGLGQAIATLPNGKQIPIKADTGNANVQLQAIVTQVNSIPAGKTVNVGIASAQVQEKLRQIGFEVKQLPDGTVEVTALTEGARQRIVGLGHLAEQGKAFPVDARTGPAALSVDRVQQLAGTPQQFSLDSLTGPAAGAIGSVHGQARAGQTFPHMANTNPAAGAVSGVHGQSRTPQTFQHNANTNPAAGSVRDVHTESRKAQDFAVNAQTNSATSAIQRLRNLASRAVSFVVNAVTGRAGGGPVGAVQARADGGPILHAANGAHVRKSPTRHGGSGRLVGAGSGTSDSIPLMGSNGEWMIRRRVVNQQGAGAMAALNAGLARIVMNNEHMPRHVPRMNTTIQCSHGGESRGDVTAHVTVNNPQAERASDSIQRQLSRMGALGMFA